MKVVPFVALVALAACSSSPKKAEPAPPAADDGAGKAQSFTIGSLEAVALLEGEFVFPNDGKVLAVGHVDEASTLLAAAGLSKDEIHLSIQPLLVKAGGKVLLFDTGAGAIAPTTGLLPASLAKAGVAPGDVTDVFISHAHMDHVGGLVANGALAFPAATIHLSAPEWAAVQADEKAKDLATAIAPKVATFEPGAQILPEVQAVATIGHTPGHSSYLIGTGDARVFYLGDVAHHSVISVQQPDWTIQFDGGEAAKTMRQQTLAKLAADHTRVYGVHFPFPGIGQVVDKGGTLVWQAE
jgi:glyoxylase-like metal-dependent hydrolase (beta-lactamase superfamily II)